MEEMSRPQNPRTAGSAVVLACCLLCATARPLWAAPSSSPLALSAAGAHLDRFLTTATRKGQFNGSVLVAQDGHILLAKGYGWADVQHHRPNQPTTHFRLASLTKQFTAMAILLLQEHGKLQVHDPLCRYVAPCPRRWRAITIQHLLTHSSGIPDYYDAFNTGRPFTRADVLRWSRARPLDFAPGTQFRYSNTGYLLLSAIIETVSGHSYMAFLQQAILDPLRLRATGYNRNNQLSPLDAIGYTQGFAPARPNDMSPGLGDGGLSSTVEDLYRWDDALFTGLFASSAVRQAMFASQVSWACAGLPVTRLCRNGTIGYGYGWFILSDDNGVPLRIITHGGAMNGFITENSYFPAQHLTVIMLSNLDTINSHLLDDEVERVLILGASPR